MTLPDEATGEGSGVAGDAQRFMEIWQACAGRVAGYCLRHADPDTAEEAVAETFLVAWRRLGDIPPEPLPWLLVVARNMLANQWRSRQRQDRLAQELARIERLAAPAEAAEVTALDRVTTLAALAGLSDRHREALLLVAWDGLAPAEAARVAGCSRPAFNLRLHRARARLRAAVEAASEVAGHTVTTQPDGGIQ
jgi:RNA polymerase sigma factor (sigma-70 family)